LGGASTGRWVIDIPPLCVTAGPRLAGVLSTGPRHNIEIAIPALNPNNDIVKSAAELPWPIRFFHAIPETVQTTTPVVALIGSMVSLFFSFRNDRRAARAERRADKELELKTLEAKAKLAPAPVPTNTDV
jgi:hypothetical protein